MILENKVLLKKFLLVSIIPIIIFLIIGNIFFTYQYQSYIQNYNNKIATLVNLIEKEYPNIDRNELVSILNSNKKPVNPVIITHKVDICPSVKLIKLPKIAIKTIFKTIAKEVGKDRLITLIKKLPLIRLLFGSKANTNEGTPIVKKLVKVN